MSIDKAIEKARRAARGSRVVSELTAVGGAITHGADDIGVHSGPVAGSPGLRQLRIDPLACHANRILLAESQRHGELEGADSSYRLLRSRIKHRILANKWWKLGVTSPGPGEGKTTTSLNLALSIAREKLRTVVLLDFDMRHPSALRYIGMEAPVQLSDYLAGRETPEKVIYETSMPYFLIGGNNRAVPDASELLASPEKVRQLFATLRSWYRDPLILVDLPPASLTDEAVLIGPYLDSLFMVVSQGKTRRDVLESSLSLLADVNIGGIILNRHSGRQAEYYYGTY